MMSGGIGAPLASACMIHRCVDMLCYSATPLPTMGQIATWTRLVSWTKAAGLGDGYSEIKNQAMAVELYGGIPLTLAGRQRANNPLRCYFTVTEQAL